jgi:hypothetical protein
MRRKKRARIDNELRDLIDAINASPNYKTVASCCGHNRYHPTIFIKDRNGHYFEFFSRLPITPRKLRTLTFYVRDGEGFFYNKVVEDYWNNKR